jgi:hypothetical protein
MVGWNGNPSTLGALLDGDEHELRDVHHGIDSNQSVAHRVLLATYAFALLSPSALVTASSCMAYSVWMAAMRLSLICLVLIDVALTIHSCDDLHSRVGHVVEHAHGLDVDAGMGSLGCRSGSLGCQSHHAAYAPSM